MSDVSGAGRIRVICGPTAAGKSSLALQLAQKFGACIVSADSRQVYRGFDIGTAKPTSDEQRTVPHYCVDTVDATDRFSAAAWAECAEHAVVECIRQERIPLLVGGTGFYLRAFFHPLFEEPLIDEERLLAVRATLNQMSLDEVRRWCESIDPDLAHLGRAQLQRAIEVSLLTGERLSAMHKGRKRAPTRRARYLLVDSGAALSDAIAARVNAMLEQGWEDEVRNLIRKVPADAPAWNATGYRDVRDLVAGNIDRREAVNRITIGTRQYAKRQRTWFRNQLAGDDVTTLNPASSNAMDLAMQWWNEMRTE